jgi:hypothetical protein
MLVAHQALLIDELRAVENARRKASNPKPEDTAGQPETLKGLTPA